MQFDISFISLILGSQLHNVHMLKVFIFLLFFNFGCAYFRFTLCFLLVDKEK